MLAAEHAAETFGREAPAWVPMRWHPSWPREVWAVRDDGTLAEPGEEGELLVNGRTVMLGYWEQPRQDGRPYRWVVDQAFAWISKNRRTVRDYERLPASHKAMILWAMIALMARSLAEYAHLSNTHLGTFNRCYSAVERYAAENVTVMLHFSLS
jgi:acyl-CoA synthetase (AMP-forming)/AMP-acid ligase II